jgi:uncharacterized protein
MISSLARGGAILDDADLTAAASEAADFIIAHMTAPNGNLYHTYRDGEASVSGLLTDYAFFVHGLIDLYQTTFDIRYQISGMGTAADR